MAQEESGISIWRIIIATILDLFTSFFLFGFVVASITGDLTEGGFELNGIPALILFILIVLYFVGGRKILGGTLWQRILGTTQQQIGSKNKRVK